MNPDERRIIGYITTAHALVHVMELTYPALLSRIEDDFGIRAVVTGAIATIFGWAFGSTAIPAGFLADRLGSRRVVMYAFTGSAVMAVLVAVSPNEWFLAVALAGLGLTGGLYHPAGLSLMSQGVRRRGTALGLHGFAGNIGQAAAPALAVGLAVLVDWRLAFFVVAGLAAVMALAFATTKLTLAHGSEVVEQPSEPAPGQGSPDRSYLLPLLVVYASFIVGAFVTVALLMGAVGQLIGGSISQRWPLERIAPVIGLATLPALLLTGIVTGPALVLICSLFIFLYFANQPVFTGLIADYSPPGAIGRSFGISFFAGFGLGSTGGVIAGALVDRWDTQAAFLGLSAFMALSVVLAFVLWAMAERRRGDLHATTVAEVAQ